MEKRFSITMHGDVAVLAINGKISIGSGATELHDRITRLISRGRNKVLLDMRETTYIDSSGIGELVHALNRVTNSKVGQRGGQFKIYGITGENRDRLANTKLLGSFDIFKELDDALASFN